MPYQDDLRRYFGEIARYAEPALTAGSAMVAEPVSGLAGLGALLSGRGVDGAAQSISSAQQAMTYQPRTMEGQQGLQGLQAFLQPVGEVIQGASQNLGDKAFAATGSPALAAAAYSAPTAFLEGLGLKGLNIARKPVGGADLYSARMGAGAVDDGGNIVRLYHGAPVEFDEFDPARVGDRLTSLGLGHYLTPNKEMAKQYGENVMEFDVDLSNMLDWQNLTPAQRTQIETALMNSIPESRISHFGERKYEILPRGKEGAARFKELKELTKDAYNDYAKARVLDDADIEEIDPSLFDRLGKDDVVVGWREGGDLSSANSQQLMTLMNEFSPELAKQLGYKASKFSDQIAIYDPKLAKRVKKEK